MKRTIEREMIVVARQADNWRCKPFGTPIGPLSPNIETASQILGRFVAQPKDLLEWMRSQNRETEIIAIDNCHELSTEAIEILADSVLSANQSVVLFGLDIAPNGDVFESTGLAMVYADNVVKADSRKSLELSSAGFNTHGSVRSVRADMRGKVEPGRVTVICGCMFAGKTGELVKRLRLADLKGLRPLMFRPSIDTRGPRDVAFTHDGLMSFPAIAIGGPSEINDIIDTGSNRFVAIDEAQFFTDELSEVVCNLKARGVEVVVSGLDRDSRGQAWRVMPRLLALADDVIKMRARCCVCGNPASTSFRKVASADLIYIGASDEYEPRCKKCFRLGCAAFSSERKYERTIS